MLRKQLFRLMVLLFVSILTVWVCYFRAEGYPEKFPVFVRTTTQRFASKTTYTPRTVQRLLCFVLASPKDGPKVEAVNKTWARRCDKTLFVYGSGSKNTSIHGDKLFVAAPEDRKFLTAKVKQAFQFAHLRFKTEFDWVLKADVDTYVIVENLKLLLSYRDPKQAVALGNHMSKHVKQGYMSGGAGYVLSSGALRDLVVQGIERGKCKNDQGDEDVEIGKCLESVNATIWSSLDKDKKETFHAEPLGQFLTDPKPTWLKSWLWNPVKFGPDCCGTYSITFHHLAPKEIYLYDHLLYHTKVYDGQPLQQDVFQNKIEMSKG